MTTERLTQVLRLRQRLVDATRDFFREHDFLETPTPIRVSAPALEDYIDAEPSGDWFLRTSPELHMKRMLAVGCARIFQLGACFRQGERGRNHLPEFTMLEWYRLHADHEDILTDTIAYLRHVLTQCLGTAQCPFRGRQIDFAGEWDRITVDEAFRLYADRDVDEAVAQGDFEEILVSRVEPHLGASRPTI
ncbi:MAG: EF-P lysine aminoacylase GenX, partial [Lentisphaeria bacterium]|nr:EF-P lysine aminoacylase GenX [Lentisphaeria bacterium]